MVDRYEPASAAAEAQAELEEKCRAALTDDVVIHVLAKYTTHAYLLSDNCEQIIANIRPSKHSWSNHRRRIRVAAKIGHLKLLDSLVGREEWDSDAAHWAAISGSLISLKWARLHGFELDKEWLGLTPLEWAAVHNRANVVEWLLCAKIATWSRRCTWNATFHGSLDVLRWADANGFDVDHSQVCDAAILHDEPKLLQWARSRGGSANLRTFESALRLGSVEKAELVLANGFTPTTSQIVKLRRECDCVTDGATRRWLVCLSLKQIPTKSL